MKHDLCTNPILASQLPHTDVSPACIHRHTSQDATLACMWHSSLLCTSTKCLILTFTTRFLSVFTYFLICFPLYSFCLCPHLSHTFPFSFLFITFTVPHTLLPTYLYMAFMKSPLPSFPLSFYFCLWHPPLSNAVGISYWSLQWGDGWSCLAGRF